MRGVRNPLLLIVLNYVVGAMVAQGVIEPGAHNDIVNLLADILGYGIIVLTSIVSVVKIYRHKGLEGKDNYQMPPFPPMQQLYPTQSGFPQVTTPYPTNGVDYLTPEYQTMVNDVGTPVVIPSAPLSGQQSSPNQ